MNTRTDCNSQFTVTLPSSNVVPFEPRPRPDGFFKLRHSLLNSTNWRSLEPAGRLAFIEIAGLYNGKNNGEIIFGVRDAKAALPFGHPKLKRAFEAIEERGLAIRRQQGRFDYSVQAERETKWQLTELVLGAQVSTNKTNGTSPLGAQVSTNTTDLGAHCEHQHKSRYRVDKKDSKKEENGFPRKEEGKEASLSDSQSPSASNPPTFVPRGADKLLLFEPTSPIALLARQLMPRAVWGADGIWLSVSEATALLAKAKGGGQ